MQSETGFPSSHQLKTYVASKSRLKLAARAVLSADAGLLLNFKRSKTLYIMHMCLLVATYLSRILAQFSYYNARINNSK